MTFHRKICVTRFALAFGDLKPINKHTVMSYMSFSQKIDNKKQYTNIFHPRNANHNSFCWKYESFIRSDFNIAHLTLLLIGWFHIYVNEFYVVVFLIAVCGDLRRATDLTNFFYKLIDFQSYYGLIHWIDMMGFTALVTLIEYITHAMNIHPI